MEALGAVLCTCMHLTLEQYRSRVHRGSIYALEVLSRYHEDGSKKLNAYCSVHGLFLTWTQRLYYITGYILHYLHGNRCLIQSNPLLPANPCLLTWRTNFFARGGKYPSTLVFGLPATAPPFASPPTLSHPTAQVTSFAQTTSATPVVLVWNRYCTLHMH